MMIKLNLVEKTKKENQQEEPSIILKFKLRNKTEEELLNYYKNAY